MTPHVDWNQFCNAVTLIGLFILTASCIVFTASVIGGMPDVFYIYTFFFGFLLSAEGVVASFYKWDRVIE